MKFDMHCHTKGGSIDSKVSVEKYIELLKKQGFSGMLITDHDSYKGYDRWKKSPRHFACKDFIVLKGIEYDTKDAGHFIVIMPDNVQLRVLQIRGMSVNMLVEIVHRFGGILGPAHPFGTKSSSAMRFKNIRRSPKIFKEFDFVEGFNTCESVQANRLSIAMANRYDLPCTGGSDSHKTDYIGKAFTEFNIDIKCNNDLIYAIKNGGIDSFGGEERIQTRGCRCKNAFYSVWGFKAYNRSLSLIFTPFRKRRIKKLSLHHSA